MDFNGDFMWFSMGCNGIYPLVICFMAIEAMAESSLICLKKRMVIFHFAMLPEGIATPK